MIIHRYQFRNCHLDYYPEMRYCETVFTDGPTIGATPHDTDEYRERAQRLGYGDDTMRMCVYHEIFHTLVSEMVGLQWSPILRALATGKEAVDNREEDAVLAMQALANVSGFTADFTVILPPIRNKRR